MKCNQSGQPVNAEKVKNGEMKCKCGKLLKLKLITGGYAAECPNYYIVPFHKVSK